MNRTGQENEKIIIHWITHDEEAIRIIRKRFNVPRYTTVNGWSPAVLRPKDKELFDKTARRGFFNYKKTDWAFNGTSYSW